MIKRSKKSHMQVLLFCAIIMLMLCNKVSYAQNQICFPPHIGLPFTYQAPNIDGYIEPDLPYDKPVDETGWTTCTSLSYKGEAGIPLMVYQCLRHKSKNFIYLSFMIKYDTNFDAEDVIVLVLHPNYANRTTTQDDKRRIDIFPLSEGLGAGSGAGYDNTLYSLRANRPPRNVEYYKWNTLSWQSTSPFLNMDIKVRSWDRGSNNKNWSVEVILPTKKGTGTDEGGNDWINLTNNFALYFNVIRVCGSALCGGSYPDIPVTTYASYQFTWPRATYSLPYTQVLMDKDIDGDDIPDLTPLQNHEIPPSWLGEAILSSSTATCKGVRFTDPWYGIGIQDPFNSGGPLLSSIHGTNKNIFMARVHNDGTDDAEAVKAEFRFAHWGMPPAKYEEWQKIPSNPNPSPDLSGKKVTASATEEFTSEWQLTPTEKAEWAANPRYNDQCLWVRLSSSQDVNFTENSIRRNMYFVGLSEHQREVEISGKGYPAPPHRKDKHEFMLLVSKTLLKAKDYFSKESIIKTDSTISNDHLHSSLPSLKKLIYCRMLMRGEEASTWLWSMNGYRNTGSLLTIGKKRFRVYEPVGGFGYIGEHEGKVKEFNDSVTGDGLKQLPDSKDSYSLEVPPNGIAKINTKIEAVKPPVCPKIFDNFGLSLHAGQCIPLNNLRKIYDPGISYLIDFQFRLLKTIPIELDAGYHTFKGKDAHNDLKVTEISAKAKYYLQFSQVAAFANAGIGAYLLDPGSTEFGFNVGGGLYYNLMDHLRIELSYNYHQLFNVDPEMKFTTLLGGIKYRF